MKKLLIALSFMFAGAAAVQAQQTDTTSSTLEGERPSATQYRKEDQDKREGDQDLENISDIKTNQDQKLTQDTTNDQVNYEKEKISQAELPALVREQITSTDYNGWTVENAYRKIKDGKTMYAIELKKDNETKMVKFDEQGNKLKEHDKDEDHDN